MTHTILLCLRNRFFFLMADYGMEAVNDRLTHATHGRTCRHTHTQTHGVAKAHFVEQILSHCVIRYEMY